MGKNKKQPVGPQDRMSLSELSVSSSFNQRSLSPATAPVFHLVGSTVLWTRHKRLSQASYDRKRDFWNPQLQIQGHLT